MPGNMKDFATGTVLTAPSPADSGNTVVLQSGEGTRMPAVPFYATAHPPAEFPTLDNAEKVQVTARTGDTLTITRGEGDTDPKSILVGWRISNTVFLDNLADTFDDLTDGTTNKAYTGTEKTKLASIETGADVTDAANVDAAGATMNTDTNVKTNSWVLDEDNMASNLDTKVPTQQSVKAYIDAAIAATKSALYPVGSIYANATDNTNPGTLLGFGTWSAFGQSRMMIGAGTGTYAVSFAASGVNTTTNQAPVDASDKTLYSGQAVVLTTTGTVPGGLTAGATYYICRATASTIGFSTSVANAVAGTIIDITSQGTGTHTVTQTLTTRTAGDLGGEEIHALTTAELAIHTHANRWRVNFPKNTNGFGTNDLGGDAILVSDNMPGGDSGAGYDAGGNPTVSLGAGSSTTHNIMSPFVVVYLWRRTA